jgi:hypothetical protein
MGSGSGEAREPVGEREHTTAWPGGEKICKRERLEETALIRAPQGLASGSLDIRGLW